MADHIIVNLDKVLASYNGNIESVVHTADLDNGSFIHLGALVDGERELRQVVIPSTTSITSEELLMVASPEVMYESGKSLKDFYNPANKPARAYHLSVGDIITLSDDAFTGATVLNQYVIPANATTKLAPAADLIGGTRFAAKVIAKGTIGFNRVAATTIQVVKV